MDLNRIRVASVPNTFPCRRLENEDVHSSAAHLAFPLWCLVVLAARHEMDIAARTTHNTV